MAIFWPTKVFVNLVIFAQIFLPANYLKVLASPKDVGKEQCIGKYQPGVDQVNVRYSKIQFKFKGLDEVPTNSTVENNGRILKIDFSYKTVPTMEVNLAPFAVAGTFRFKFLYFQWLKTSPVEGLFPAQLHAVFYDANAKSYDEAAVADKKIIVVAFAIHVHTKEDTLFGVLQEYLKDVREPNRKTTIKNISLKYLSVSLSPEDFKYYAHEGSFSEFPCQGTVVWVDLEVPLLMSDQTVNELKELKSNTGALLMSQVSEFVKPRGPVYTSKENTILSMPGLIIGVLFLIFYSY